MQSPMNAMFTRTTPQEVKRCVKCLRGNKRDAKMCFKCGGTSFIAIGRAER